MAKQGVKCEDNTVWLVDSGCFDHMTGQKNLFRDLNETRKQSVKLGDNKELKIEG